MISKILDLFGSSISKYLTIIVAVVSAAGSWYVTRLYYLHEIDQMRLEWTTQAAKQEHNNAEKISKAYGESLSNSVSLGVIYGNTSSLVNRVQHNLSSDTKDSGSKGTNTEELSRCRKLLSEGAKLLEIACREYGKCAIDKDALSEMVK